MLIKGCNHAATLIYADTQQHMQSLGAAAPHCLELAWNMTVMQHHDVWLMLHLSLYTATSASAVASFVASDSERPSMLSSAVASILKCLNITGSTGSAAMAHALPMVWSIRWC
jgi:hypothetical protein